MRQLRVELEWDGDNIIQREQRNPTSQKKSFALWFLLLLHRHRQGVSSIDLLEDGLERRG
jgi:hypothetical protein